MTSIDLVLSAIRVTFIFFYIFLSIFKVKDKSFRTLWRMVFAIIISIIKVREINIHMNIGFPYDKDIIMMALFCILALYNAIVLIINRSKDN